MRLGVKEGVSTAFPALSNVGNLALRHAHSHRSDMTLTYYAAAILIAVCLLFVSSVNLNGLSQQGASVPSSTNLSPSFVETDYGISTSGVIDAAATTSFGINISSGGSEYVYAVATGGAEITSFAFSADLSVNTSSTVILVGHSSDSSASYSSNAIYPIICGAELSAAATGLEKYHSVNSTQLSGIINLNRPSDVILVAAVSSLYNPTVSSPFHVDAVDSNSVVDGVLIASASFDAGAHSFTISCTPWHTPLAIGAVLYVIPSTTITGTTGTGGKPASFGSLFGSSFYFLAIIVVAIVVAVSIGYSRKKKKSAYAESDRTKRRNESQSGTKQSDWANYHKDDGAPNTVQKNSVSESTVDSGVGISAKPAVSYCARCGSRLRTGARYCGSCGNEVRSNHQ
ncbi:MAG: zinc ribbon domain-containing protein [Nitrososphaerota archaeon]|nr:zinc ribbon domain-containing protein [Nitrososphaerota archaeon]